MENKQDYLKRLQKKIGELHKCAATHRRTVSVKEVIHRRRTWEGDVEVFWLTGHPRAKRCYAWCRKDSQGTAEDQVVTVLEISPVIGPATAVRAALASRAETEQKCEDAALQSPAPPRTP